MRSSLALALVLLAGCPAPEPTIPGAFPAGEVAFTVNGKDVPVAAVSASLDAMPDAQRAQAVAAGQAKAMLEGMALGESLYQDAITQKLHEDPAVQARLALAVREALAQIVVERAVEAAVTDEKIAEAYEKRKVQFTKREAKVRILPVADEATAKEVKALLDAGADFLAVAKEKSIDQRLGEMGGDLGWVTPGQLAGPIDAALFAEGAGTGLIGPFSVGGPWVILKVDERRDGVPLEEVRDQLEQQVRQEAAETFISEKRTALAVDFKKTPEELVGGAPAPAAAAEAAPAAAPAGEAAPAAPAAEAPAEGH